MKSKEVKEINMQSADRLLHIDLDDGNARVLLCDTTATVQKCADIHSSTPVCTAAMGRLLTGTAMIGVMMKGDEESVTVTVKGNGPMGTLVSVADHGDVRVCADDPSVSLPLRPDGKLDVGGAVGHEGRMNVIRDLGNGKQYIGQSELVSGEIAMDFAQYFVTSEQQPSLVALGVLVHGQDVLKSGGILIQPLPGCSEETISQLELRSPFFTDISKELTFGSLEELAGQWFRGLKPKILQETKIRYHCGCSRKRMEKALISLGRKELQEMIDDGKGAELNCRFCHSRHFFDTEQLKELLSKAQRP